MLLEWSRFVREVDPDIITGYNITNFDFYFLLNRAKVLIVRNVHAAMRHAYSGDRR